MRSVSVQSTLRSSSLIHTYCTVTIRPWHGVRDLNTAQQLLWQNQGAHKPPVFVERQSQGGAASVHLLRAQRTTERRCSCHAQSQRGAARHTHQRATWAPTCRQWRAPRQRALLWSLRCAAPCDARSRGAAPEPQACAPASRPSASGAARSPALPPTLAPAAGAAASGRVPRAAGAGGRHRRGGRARHPRSLQQRGAPPRALRRRTAHVSVTAAAAPAAGRRARPGARAQPPPRGTRTTPRAPRLGAPPRCPLHSQAHALPQPLQPTEAVQGSS